MNVPGRKNWGSLSCTVWDCVWCTAVLALTRLDADHYIGSCMPEPARQSCLAIKLVGFDNRGPRSKPDTECAKPQADAELRRRVSSTTKCSS